ncbi:MAG TPA: membrane dipeptidase [Solirubrobacterales bacterium]|nr:membrane dipeptidase [Solirubrobacterales bacterium]
MTAICRAMLADMHCHYPMHVVAEEPQRPLPGTPNLTVEAMAKVSQQPGWLEKLRAAVLRTAASRLEYGDDRWRVNLDELTAGDVRAVFSVLYGPFAESKQDEPGSPPERGYFAGLLDQIDQVEADLTAVDPNRDAHEVVRSGTDLDRVTDEGKVAFMHCIEGGFHLGGAIDEIDANVAALARRGVVYVTLAHHSTYKALFRQPRRGLSKLGVAAIEAMYRHKVLIDVSHMNQRALCETFALLERLDRESGRAATEYPVIATHAGYRFGEQEYMLSPSTICKIADRGGVIGLVLARHPLHECAGVANPDDPGETPLVVRRHIDAIRAATPENSNAHVAIGSDLDGFIKPTVAGIETAGDLAMLEAPLRQAYGADAEAILSGNAMRVARAALG